MRLNILFKGIEPNFFIKYLITEEQYDNVKLA